MFGIDPVKIIEDFMMTPKGDKIIADIIGQKIKIDLEKEGSLVTFTLSYGPHKISEKSIDISSRA